MFPLFQFKIRYKSYLFVVVNEAKGQPSCEHYIVKFKLTSYIVFKFRFLF